MSGSNPDTTELRIGPDAHIDPAPVDNTPPPEVDPQAEFRLSIAEKFEQRRLAEIEAQREQMGLPPEAEPAPSDASSSTADASDPEPADHPVVRSDTQPAPDTPAPTSPSGPQLHPVQTPDGQVFWCTIEQVAQLAGLGAGAMARTPQQAPTPTPTHQASFDTERARTIANRLSFGDPEEQARALTEFAQEIRGPAIDANQIRQQIKQEMTAEMQVERDLQQIGTEYAPIFNNRYATVAAAAAVSDLRANPYWANRPPLEVYREACKNVARDFNLVPQQSQPGLQTSVALQAAPTGQAARIERKRAAPSIPVATDRRVAMADDTPREPTPGEVVDQIRKARGQPSLR